MDQTVKRDTVLVVEDEALLNIDVAQAIRGQGFNVLQAYSGEQALEHLQTDPAIRVVFTDVNLPGMSGIELATEIDRNWPQVAILVTSGRLVPEIVALDVVSRYGRFVPKPYPPEAVTRRIHEIVGDHA